MRVSGRGTKQTIGGILKLQTRHFSFLMDPLARRESMTPEQQDQHACGTAGDRDRTSQATASPDILSAPEGIVTDGSGDLILVNVQGTRKMAVSQHSQDVRQGCHI